MPQGTRFFGRLMLSGPTGSFSISSTSLRYPAGWIRSGFVCRYSSSHGWYFSMLKK